MKMRIVNNSGAYANGDIYVCFLGQNSSGDYGYLELAENLVTGETGSLNFVAATATSQKTANTVPSYSLDTLASLASAPTIPDYVNSGRGYLSIGSKLDIAIWNSGYVGPAFMIDTNYTKFDFFEFFFDPSGTPTCNADLSPLDWVSIPLSMEFDDSTGTTVAGPVGFNETCEALFTAFSSDDTFKDLIVTDPNYSDQVRILAPGHGITNGLFSATYLDTYIDTVWTHYAQSGNTLALNPSPVNSKVYTGSVKDDKFVFTDTSGIVASSISKPTTQDVFLCNGAFNGTGTGTAFQIDANIKNQVVSALNRGILPLAAGGALCDSSNFYVTTTDNGGLFNGFSHKLHQNSFGGKCYGFAYDDQCDQSSDVSVDNPDTFKITILA